MRRLPNRLKYAAITTGVLLMAVGLGIYWELVSKIALTNETAYALVNARVGLEKDHGVLSEVFWQGGLKSGDSKWVWKIADSSGILNLSFEINGEKVNLDLGYVGLSASYRIHVRSKDDIGVVEIPRMSDLFRE